MEYAVWIDMLYGSHASATCSASNTSLFSNITVLNLHVDGVTKAAYEIVGLEVVGDGSGPAPREEPIRGVVLSNVTVLNFDKAEHGVGECTHASVRTNAVTPSLPRKVGCDDPGAAE